MSNQRASAPWLDNMHLQWFGDGDLPADHGTPAGPDSGQGDGSGGGTPEGTPPAPASPFHSWTDPEGQTYAFKDANELNNHLKSTHFRQSKFTTSMQELASERQRLAELAKSLQGLDTEYAPFKKLKDTHPALYAEFAQRLKQGPGPQDVNQSLRSYVDQAIKKVIDQFTPYKERLDERAFLDEVESTYGELEKEVPGFDRKKVDELAQLLGSQKNRKELFKRLHFSLLGEMDPAERLRLQQERAETERQADLGSRSVSAPAAPKVPTSVEDGRLAALRELKGK